MKILADDGTEFDSMEECRAYERDNSGIKIEDSLIFFDIDEKTYQIATKTVTDGHYLLIKSVGFEISEICDYMNELIDGAYWEIERINSFGLYQYDYAARCWCPVNELIQEHLDAVDTLTRGRTLAEKIFRVNLNGQIRRKRENV